VIPVNHRYDEVSARAQVPLLDMQRLSAPTDNLEVGLNPDRDSTGDQAKRISLFTSVVDLALVLKHKYFS